jgi:hypothetical protein
MLYLKPYVEIVTVLVEEYVCDLKKHPLFDHEEQHFDYHRHPMELLREAKKQKKMDDCFDQIKL